ncbi:MAG: polysaccharide ABC transporter ATP-binding protein [Gemmatimonadaceae bacterium]
MSPAGIIFDSVWKKFHRGEMHDSLRELIPATVRRMVRRGPRAEELQHGDFWAIKDLSFDVKPGQTLGIIGPNGSGKSTTLKLLTRIYQPTRGFCELRGRVGCLIEVAAGFHGDLTGRENVYLQGAIMGMRTREIQRKFDEIVEFSGIADFIDTPVKRYSSGMNARLGFAIAAHLEPDVLIIDEVLAVGDLAFQEKAFGRMRDLARSGIPVVMVSHQLERIADLCTDAIFLRKGEIAARGNADEVIAAYVKQNEVERAVTETGVVCFDSAELHGDNDVVSGQRVRLRVTGRITEPVPENVEPVQLRLRSLRTGNVMYRTGSRRLGVQLNAPGTFDLQIELQCNVAPGRYAIEVAAYNTEKLFDVAVAPAIMVCVADTDLFRGFVQLNAIMQSSHS